MYMFSPTGEPKFVNDSYLDLLSMTRAELVEKAATGLAWRDTVYHEDVERLGKTWAIMGVSKAPTKVEYRVLTKSDSPDEEQGWKWVEAISFPELDEEGRVITVMGWIYDISLRKLTEGLMAQRLEDALENKRASERFIVSSPFINLISVTSHEFGSGYPRDKAMDLLDALAAIVASHDPLIAH